VRVMRCVRNTLARCRSARQLLLGLVRADALLRDARMTVGLLRREDRKYVMLGLGS
jgi:hypothetical protein